MLGAGAFQALAGYIFGKNKREEKMAMTTPVFTRAGQMEFVLPEAYWKDLGKAPPPLTNVEVTYGEGGLVAASFYGGYVGISLPTHTQKGGIDLQDRMQQHRSQLGCYHWGLDSF